MTKSKSLLTAVSVVALTGLFTACSSPETNTATVTDTVTVPQNSENSTDKQALALKNKIEANHMVASNLQLSANAKRSEDECSVSQINEALSNGALTDRIIEFGADISKINVAMMHILGKAETNHCKVSALAEVARVAAQKYNSPQNYILPGDPDFNKLDSFVQQAALINSVIGPKINSLRDEINASERSTFQNKASVHNELAATIDDVAKKVASQVVLMDSMLNSCDMTCSDKINIIASWNPIAKNIVSESESLLANHGAITANDPNIDAKTRELEKNYAALATVQMFVNDLVYGDAIAERVGKRIADDQPEAPEATTFAAPSNQQTPQ